MDEVLERKNNSDEGESTMLKKLAAVTIALVLFVFQSLPSFACGALVAPQVLLAVVILLSIGGGLFMIVRGKRRARVRAQV